VYDKVKTAGSSHHFCGICIRAILKTMKKYVIPAGEHYSTHSVKIYSGKTSLPFIVNFDESCSYDLGTIDQLDVNKLAGVSFGNHETNSIRIGWAYNLETQKMDLFAYCYENGVRIIHPIGNCNLSEDVSIKLELNFKNNFFRVTRADSAFQEFSYTYPFLKAGYYLFPYFGGNNPAPHEMIIYLDGI
jgi:hypothetical protein